MKKIIIAAMMLMGFVGNVSAQNETDDDGVLIAPNIYDEIHIGNDNMIVVNKDNKYGVINSEGKLVVPLQFDGIGVAKINNNCGGLIRVSYKSESKALGEKEFFSGLYNTEGKLVLSCDNNFENISIQDGEYGFEGLAEVDIFDKVRIDTIYKFPENSKNLDDLIIDRIEATRLTKSGVLLENGTILSSYEDYDIEYGGLIEVKKDRKHGVLNKKGEVIIPLKYNDIRIKNKLIRVETPYNGKRGYGIFDDKGKIIVPIGKYESLDVNWECVIVEKNKQKGAVSLKGVEIIPIGMYEKIYEKTCEDGRNHYISVYKGKNKGAVSCSGKLFIPCGKYSDFEVIDDNLSVVSVNDKKGIINKNGAIIIPVGKYNDIRFKYGVIYYSQNGKYGIIDKNGKQVTSAEFDEIRPERHSYGVASVKKDGKIGMVDSEGRLIMPLADYVDGKMFGEVGMLKNDKGTVFFKCDGSILADYGKYELAVKKYGDLQTLKLSPHDGLFVSVKNNKKGVVKLW